MIKTALDVIRSRRWLAAALTLAAVLLLCLPAAESETPTDPQKTARISAASKVYQAKYKRWQSGMGAMEDVHRWSVHLLESELAVAGKSAARKRAFTDHEKRMKKAQKHATGMVASGMAAVDTADEASFYATEAAIWRAALAFD